MIAIVLIFVYMFGFLDSLNFDIECVPLRECPELFSLISNKEQPVSEKVKELLQTSHCGFSENHPKVWCAVVNKKNECRTPHGELGRCMPFKDCKPFLRLLSSPTGRTSNTIHYLQNSQCSNFNTKTYHFSVCCPNEKAPFVNHNLNTYPTKSPVINPPIYLPRPSEGKCGRQLVNRIIGGVVTEMDEFPWTALLQYQSRSRISTRCAGSLINNRYVVTAAHCVDNIAVKSGKPTNVILGEFDTRTETDCINSLGIEDCADPPVRIPIEEIIIHPEWYKRPSAEINYDIALLRLAHTVRFTNYIQPICLPSPTLNIREENLVVTGWGKTENGMASHVKLKTTLSVADRKFCVEKYKLDKKLIVGDGEMCVGGKQGKDSCSGDSGGPLMLSMNKNGYSAWFLVGIVSFGSNQPCGLKDFPGLYTFVPKYVNWIYQIVRP